MTKNSFFHCVDFWYICYPKYIWSFTFDTWYQQARCTRYNITW